MGTVPIDQFEAILNILPSWIRLFAREYQEELEEIALQEGRPPSLWLGNRFVEGERVVEPSDLEAVKQKLKAEYQVEFREDGRAGISGTLHRISALYDRYGILVGMTIRLARVVKGLADPIIPFLLDGKSLLIIGPPGVGKTTLLRDVIRQLAIIYGPKVVIVDTSNEIGGEGRVPHPVLGASKRVQVRIPDPMKGENHLSMLARAYYEAVANHGPQIVVGDEVSSKDDVAVVETIGRRGVWAVVTVHGRVLRDVLGNPVLHPLVGYPDMERGRLLGTPVFDMGMEVRGRGLFHLYLSLEEALQETLEGRQPRYVRIRFRFGEGAEAVMVHPDGTEEPYALPSLPPEIQERYAQAEDKEVRIYGKGQRQEVQTLSVPAPPMPEPRPPQGEPELPANRKARIEVLARSLLEELGKKEAFARR